MKLPIIISILLFLVSGASISWITKQNFELVDATTIIVYIVTALGGLISAVFVVYGYFVNLSVFKESQKPKLLLQVHNDRRIFQGSGLEVHQTVLRYANLSQNECRNLKLTLALIRENETIYIPRLFTQTMNIGPNDDRTRDFPTLVYFQENGIPQAVINNLQHYKLRVSYSYQLMGEDVSSYYDYQWSAEHEGWGIV